MYMTNTITIDIYSASLKCRLAYWYDQSHDTGYRVFGTEETSVLSAGR